MPISLTSGLGASLFPAQAASLQAQALVSAAQHQDLMMELRRGTILYDIQDRPEAKMPRLVTLWSIPVPMERAADAMRDVDHWADWMPRFTSSRRLPSGQTGSYFQEAKMKAAGLTIHYRILVHERQLDLGLQLYWGLDETGFHKDRFAMGLAINNGSCAFYPLSENETLAVYTIHTQVTPLLPGTKGKITNATIEELPQFPASLASRCVNPQWSSRMPPLFRPFSMQKAG
ncbi:MAG TPA: SRPBCC family protein [bacterium]|nr:SRPBCC family protein [bacterium]